MKVWYEIYSKIGRNLSMAIDRAPTFKKAKKLRDHLEKETGSKLYIDKWTEDENGKQHTSKCHEASTEDIVLYVHRTEKHEESFASLTDAVYS